jgi:hypothetical protein
MRDLPEGDKPAAADEEERPGFFGLFRPFRGSFPSFPCSLSAVAAATTDEYPTRVCCRNDSKESSGVDCAKTSGLQNEVEE